MRVCVALESNGKQFLLAFFFSSLFFLKIIFVGMNTDVQPAKVKAPDIERQTDTGGSKRAGQKIHPDAFPAKTTPELFCNLFFLSLICIPPLSHLIFIVS